jgi:hypothetical protein
MFWAHDPRALTALIVKNALVRIQIAQGCCCYTLPLSTTKPREIQPEQQEQD